jgi:uncharacterized protein
MTMEVTTADGVTLEADLAPAAAPIAGAVLCHPHPRFGGDRHNAVVEAVFRALPAAGITAVRFDFRPGAGAEGTDLAEERRDVVAVLDELARTLPGRSLFLVGYSFGAGVALGVDHPAVTAQVVVAPPLVAMPVAAPRSIPTLALFPAHDQFTAPAVAEPIVASWPTATPEVIPGADHFLAGHTAEVADRTTRWLVEQAEPRHAG